MKVLPLHVLQAARPLRGLDDHVRKMVHGTAPTWRRKNSVPN